MTVRELRRRAGLTQKDFSVLFGIPRRTLEDWERGVRTPAPYLVSLIEFRLRAKEIFAEIEEILKTQERYLYCNPSLAYAYEMIAELKKKYESEDTE